MFIVSNRRSPRAVLAAALSVTLAVALMSVSGAATASGLPAYPFLHVSGTGFAYAAPDLGEIDFEISADDPSPEAALATVQARIDELLALAAEQGLEPADVEIRDVRREMRKGEGPSRYDIKCAVHIYVRDLTKWRAIVQPLLDKPNLDGFATTFGVTQREKIEDELMASALKDARRKAGAMAAGLGKRVGEATAVSSQELKNLARAIGLVPTDRYNANSGAGRAPQERSSLLMVNVQRMSQSVDVVFRIAK